MPVAYDFYSECIRKSLKCLKQGIDNVKGIIDNSYPERNKV